MNKPVKLPSRPQDAGIAEEARARRAPPEALEDLQRERDAIREARMRWVATFDAVRDPMMVHDAGYRVVRCNRAYAALAGLDVDEIIGKPYWQMFPKLDGPLPGCSRVAAGLGPSVEEEFRLPGGKVYLSKSFPLAGIEGQTAEFLHVMQDITEREAAQQVLRESEARYRGIFERAKDVIFMIDAGGIFTELSPSFAQVSGWSPEEWRGKPFISIVHPDETARALKIFEKTISSQISSVFEMRIRKKSGDCWTGDFNVSPLEVGGATVLFGIGRDITERRADEEKLLKVNRALKTLSAGNVALVRATDENGLLNEMVRVITQVGGYPMAFVGYALDDAGKTVEMKAGLGFDPADVREAPISWGDNERGQSAVGRAVRLGEPQFDRNVQTSPDYARWPVLRARNIGAVLGLPLRITSGEQPFGAIGIAADEADAFDTDELNLLGELSYDLAFGIANLRVAADNRAATEKLRRSLESTIEAIAATMETRDPYTAGHQRRVAVLAAAIAGEMGLEPLAVEGLRFGALIHDLGKIQVPAEILAKPTRLSKLEFELIKVHAQAGYDIIKGIDFPWPVALMVLQHHERLDGSGYPQGLKGDAIAPEARILAVADVVEAMSSHRPYRPGLGIEAALKEIEDKRGKWFEPVVVNACLRLFREKSFRFETQ
jgi:PAS domain S-box-containing protein